MNDVKIGWKNEVRYLGIYILSGMRFKINIQPAKQKFFRAANGILGKIACTKNPSVCLSLLNSFCTPILLYGLEALNLNKATRESLEFVFNSLFVKIFNIKDKEALSLCQWYMGYLPVSCVLDLKMINFHNDILCNKSDSLMFIIDKLAPSAELGLIIQKYSPTNWQSFLDVSHRVRKTFMFDLLKDKLNITD